MHFTLNQLLLSLNQYIYMHTHFPAFALIPKNAAFQFMLLFFPPVQWKWMRHGCHSLPAAVRVFRLHLLGRHSRDWWDRVVLKEFSGEERWEELWNFLQGFFKSLQWWREPCVSRVGQRMLQWRCKWQLWLCKILVRSVSSFISNPAIVTIYTLTTICFAHTIYSEVRWNVLVHVNIPN